jgi:hypothetical protein
LLEQVPLLLEVEQSRAEKEVMTKLSGLPSCIWQNLKCTHQPSSPGHRHKCWCYTSDDLWMSVHVNRKSTMSMVI